MSAFLAALEALAFSPVGLLALGVLVILTLGLVAEHRSTR